MYFSTIILTTALVAASSTMATPALRRNPGFASYTPCSGFYNTPQCCATDVLGVVDLDCASPSAAPTSAADFTEICVAIGERARCCALPVLSQDVLCETPVGV